MFYLTTYSTHFNLRLYGVGHMVKDHSDSKRGNPLPPHGLLLTARVLLYAPSHGQDLLSVECVFKEKISICFLTHQSDNQNILAY